MKAVERFSSRWGLILATLGMAVGTGNIWRFPRVAATNGGGNFLVAWLVFLFLWSIPLIIVEFSFGKTSRRGVIGAFSKLAGRGATWMGAVGRALCHGHHVLLLGGCRLVPTILLGDGERRAQPPKLRRSVGLLCGILGCRRDPRPWPF